MTPKKTIQAAMSVKIQRQLILLQGGERGTVTAKGGTGKDAQIRKGKVGRGKEVLRIRGGVKKICPRGGRKARPNKRARAQIRRADRLGPEGLGDRNDADDSQQELEEEDNETNESGLLNQQSGASVPVPEEPILSNVAVNVISALASVARDCIQQSSESRIISNIHAVVAVLQDSESTVTSEPHPSSISLAALAARCKKSELIEACAHLRYWLSVLWFACGMSRWVLLHSCYGFSHLPGLILQRDGLIPSGQVHDLWADHQRI
jgi:hypothetical protein